MPASSTIALCLGNFLRQKLKAKRQTVAAPLCAKDVLQKASAPASASAPEAVVLQNLVALYDPGTGAHAQRLMQLASATGRQLSISEKEIQRLGLAALLHDIGKVGVPKVILEKPGPLNEEEWRIMRLHPEIGQDILLSVGGRFASLAPIVLAHHERWDGCGYPNGLAGEAIPLLARILAVVDSYDAMVSRRAYCAPLSIQEARMELQRCAGSQYDPRVVAAFLAVPDEQNVQAATCLSVNLPFAGTTQDVLQYMLNLSCEALPTPSPTKKLIDDFRQNPVEDVPEPVDEEYATLSLQSVEYAPLSA